MIINGLAAKRPAITSLTVTENGTYTAPSGTDGYNPVTVAVPNPSTGSLAITENGTYDVTTKASAVVNVPSSSGDPYQKLIQILDKSVTYLKSTEITTLTASLLSGKNNLEYASFPNLTTITNYNLHSCAVLYFVNAGKISTFNLGLQIQANNLKTLVLPKKALCTMTGWTANSGVGRGYTTIYVPDYDSDGAALPAQYKVATNWSNIANNIKGFSEAPDYASTTTYNIGDVCKYNSKFYSYCKEDLTSSTGNAPTGTASDNTYWEYIGELEVSV